MNNACIISDDFDDSISRTITLVEDSPTCISWTRRSTNDPYRVHGLCQVLKIDNHLPTERPPVSSLGPNLLLNTLGPIIYTIIALESSLPIQSIDRVRLSQYTERSVANAINNKLRSQCSYVDGRDLKIRRGIYQQGFLVDDYHVALNQFKRCIDDVVNHNGDLFKLHLQGKWNTIGWEFI